jgi:hypothetical protein
VNAVLYLARDTIDDGEQTGFLVIGPEQGDLGELCQVPFHLHRGQPHAPVNAVSLLGEKSRFYRQNLTFSGKATVGLAIILYVSIEMIYRGTLEVWPLINAV